MELNIKLNKASVSQSVSPTGASFKDIYSVYESDIKFGYIGTSL